MFTLLFYSGVTLMKEEILKALKSIESVSILKGPVKRKTKPARVEDLEHGTDGEYYECVLFVNGQLLPVAFHKGEDVRQKLAETCKKWNITFLP